jgi:hypothetical protein
MRAKQLSAVLAVLALVSIACSAGERSNREAQATDSTVVAPPSTVLTGAASLRVPFVADNGTLTAVVGPAPKGVSAEQADAEMRHAMGVWVQSPPTQPSGYRPLAARVTLVPGLGVSQLENRSAWIVPFAYTRFPSCPDVNSSTTLPPWASKLQVVIVTTSDPRSAIIYEGAGAGLCGPRGTPTASTNTS